MPNPTVKSRLVFNFQGFEAGTGEKLLGRTIYCAAKTSELWGLRTKVNSQEHYPQDYYSECELITDSDVCNDDTSLQTTSLQNTSPQTTCQISSWQVNTRVIQFSFADIVAPYLSGFFVWKFLKYLPNLLAFYIDGTVFKYFKQSKLYGAFVLFPVIIMLLFASLAYVVASALGGWFDLPAPMYSIFTAVISIALFFVLCKWPGEQLLLPLTMSHWGYARDVATGANKKLEDRYDIFADIVCRELEHSQHDEIIFAGHSFGAVWAPMVLARVQERNAALLTGRRLTFMSMGGSLLNTALVAKADFLRENISNLLKLKELFWHDYQCKDDPVCFYKSDMFTALGLGKPKGGYQISRVNFKHSMDLQRYRKMKKSIYDVHRQYALYQDQCVSFEYFLRLLGPVFADDLAKDPSKAKLINTKKDIVVQDVVIKST